MRTLLINSLVMFVVAAGGIPLLGIQSVRTVLTIQQELAQFSRLPLAAKIAKVRANPKEEHLVLQLLNDIETFTLNISDVIGNPNTSARDRLSQGDMHYFRAVMRGAINEMEQVTKELQERKRKLDIDFSGEDH